ncbi:MAG: hypothetical protein WHV26_13505 [Spirochaetota bacterium]
MPPTPGCDIKRPFLGEVGGSESAGNSRLFKCCIIRANKKIGFVQ